MYESKPALRAMRSRTPRNWSKRPSSVSRSAQRRWLGSCPASRPGAPVGVAQIGLVEAMPQHLYLRLDLLHEAEEGAFPLRIVGLGGHGNVASVALLPNGGGQFAQVLQPALQCLRRLGVLGQQDLPERVDLFPAAHVRRCGGEPGG